MKPKPWLVIVPALLSATAALAMAKAGTPEPAPAPDQVLEAPAPPAELEAYPVPSCERLNEVAPAYRATMRMNLWPIDSGGPFTCPSEVSRIIEALYLIDTVRFKGDRFDYGGFVRRFQAVYYNPLKISNAITNLPFQGALTIFGMFQDAPLYQRAAVLVHEAAHVLNSLPHVACTRGVDQGKPTCDQEFRLDGGGGGYSWGFQYMLQLATKSNYPLTDKERTEILDLLDWELANRYNNLSDEQVEQLRWELLGRK